MNGDPREPTVLTDDRKLLSQLPIRDKMILTAKLCQANSNTASSPESSSDSSTSSPQHPYNGPNLEAENVLPGVVSLLIALRFHFFPTHKQPFFCFFCS